tara:strand:- start:2671 stop:3954 length:1284 start_codon:yes stop_codon:yes gene_type:complete
MKYKLIIIGSGISGICAAKWAKKYGISFIVIEKNKDIGGVWYNVNYSGLKLQTMKDYYQFNDFPFSKEVSQYPTRNEIIQYLKEAIHHYKIEKNILYNTNVESIKYDDTNKMWNIQCNKSLNFYSQYLIIATGFYNSKKIPNLDIKNFTGKVIHSSELNKLNKKDIYNKNIVIVGNGSTGCDLTCNLQKYAKNTSLIYRSNRWIVQRYYDINKGPIQPLISSHAFVNKFSIKLGEILPIKIYVIILALAFCFYFYSCDYKFFINLPKEKMNRNNVTFSEKLFGLIDKNKINYIKSNTIKFTKNSIITDNQNIEADTVILSTGYKNSIPLLNIDNTPLLYNHIIHPDINNCGFIGYAASFNWLIISDIQSKWYILHMLKNIKYKKDHMYKRISEHIKIQNNLKLDYSDLTYSCYNYIDELTNDIKKIE